MAKTIHSGYYLAAGGSSATLHTAAGILLGFLVSHTNASTTQTITFFDASAATPGTEILVVNVRPDQCPTFIMFDRDKGIPFSTALHVQQASCDLAVWSVDHG